MNMNLIKFIRILNKLNQKKFKMSGFMLIKICEHQQDPKYQNDKSRGSVCKLPIECLNESKDFSDVID